MADETSTTQTSETAAPEGEAQGEAPAEVPAPEEGAGAKQVTTATCEPGQFLNPPEANQQLQVSVEQGQTCCAAPSSPGGSAPPGSWRARGLDDAGPPRHGEFPRPVRHPVERPGPDPSYTAAAQAS